MDDERGAAQAPSEHQLALLHAAAATRRTTARATSDDGPELPVAQVAVDVGLPHLDRPFEYAVPVDLDDTALPGARVKVRFAGKDVSGFVLARVREAEHVGKLTDIRRVVSPEAALTPAIARLCREVADRYAGTFSDVVRLAVPARHAAAEKALDAKVEGADAPSPESGGEEHAASAAPDPTSPGTGAWGRYPAGPAFLHRLGAGGAPAAAWLAAPTTDPVLDWPTAMAQAARATLDGGRGAVLVVPDHRDVDRLDEALTEQLGPGRHVRLTASQGPQARYTAFLKLLRGHVRCVVGTRAAAFAPVADLGLVAWWDDGDDLLAEPRAPYPHVREVLRLRAEHEGAGLLSGGFARSVAIQQWVQQGALQSVDLPVRRAAVPRVIVAGDERDVERSGAAARAHLPSAAWRAAHEALQHGPVLVQVPRRGYLPSLRCDTCRDPARCAVCHGPLALTGSGETPVCRWCGVPATPFDCPNCHSHRLRAGVVGARRTAEELGRAFPGVPVVRSGAGEVVAHVSSSPALVIATPGAEPVAAQGYRATLLLDAWALVDRPVLSAGEETLRRWCTAAALTRSQDDDGVVVVCGVRDDEPLPVVQALVRWAPAWLAERELAEREALALPPAVWMAGLTGDAPAVVSMDRGVGDGFERIGPLAHPERDGTVQERLLLRTSLEDGPRAAAALHAARAGRSARKEPGSVTVRVDPAGDLL
ncbi:primosomal protein N' [Allobranchiibius sp. GilTou73]|uniref:primosomal protein N' n=1 Tax=Allobranchiibius sp. GilTou73 TaxID=2904523 RepID=UPI001F25C60C|nr:primosomal protein N' [Allobranchiibius sp. GilTou73]UIJ34141.1 primosomal protein N' [Allobranchiibius sp. GilTou73]